MAIKRGLGRGLDNLIPTDEAKSDKPPVNDTKVKTEVKEVIKKVEQTLNINRIEPNKSQPRKNFDEDALVELADSIKQFGIIEPLVVTKKKGYYEDGELPVLPVLKRFRLSLRIIRIRKL